MGRALQKERGKRHTPSSSTGGMAMRTGVESINVIKDQNRASVLDVNDLDDFLIQAEMANREFASEKERFVVLDATAQAAEEQQGKVISWSDQLSPKQSAFAFHELSVPRRPEWDERTTAAELDKREKEAFLEWRRAIAKREEEIILRAENRLGVTPFEKNLEIWRQLWRVMERCSCIVQIVDARNPLFYLSRDLKKYATEELGKPMLLLINKSDYLTAAQRRAWSEFFSTGENRWEHVFFSAHEQQLIIDKASAGGTVVATEGAVNVKEQSPQNYIHASDDGKNGIDTFTANDNSSSPPPLSTTKNVGVNYPLSREELLEWLNTYAKNNDCPADPKYDRVPFGMVGFPNVGKSSVINVLMGNAKHTHGVVRVGVASQPGKTKHFQTLLLPDRTDMLLCDCPGLVFPSFVNNTADLIAAGVFPIAQMRDPWPVVDLLCKRIPRDVLNAHYGIQIPMPSADAMLNAEARNGGVPPPTAEEFLTTYCIARSMLASSSGVPDYQRASRVVIKDYATGRLLYCHSPPSCDDESFQKQTLITAVNNTKKLRQKLLDRNVENHLAGSDGYDEDANGGGDDDDDEKDGFEGDNENFEGGGNDIDEDDLMLELLGGSSEQNTSSQKNGSNGKPGRKKRWGKKGRKLRNKDPYGCHSTPDDVLGGNATPAGVSVNAGKYGKKGYTRPTGYGMARSTAY